MHHRTWIPGSWLAALASLLSTTAAAAQVTLQDEPIARPPFTLPAGADGHELLAAAAAGAADRVHALLAAGADAAMRDEAGRTALHLAAGAGHLAAVRALLDGPLPAAPQSALALIDGRPVNLFASELRGADTVIPPVGTALEAHVESLSFDRFLQRCEHLDAVDARGRTPLHLAAAAGHAPVIDLLCERGASLDAADERGATPLHLAALAGRGEAVDALLSRGAHPGVKTRAGCRAADLAADETLRTRLREARRKLTQGEDAAAVRTCAQDLFEALRRGDRDGMQGCLAPEFGPDVPPALEVAAFDFRIIRAEALGNAGAARAWVKVPDLAGPSNEFVAEVRMQRSEGKWRVCGITADPFLPDLETLEDQP